MPFLTVRHVTTYRYRNPVAFGEHRLLVRPRESFDQRVLDAQLRITPAPAGLYWHHDVFGNCVAVARFDRRAKALVVDSFVRLDHSPVAAVDFMIEDYARGYPFAYSPDELPDLSRSIEQQFADPERRLARWARRFVGAPGRTDTLAMLAAMTRAIHADFTYVARHAAGTQSPLETLARARGTCRDFAVLMIEATRSLGLAARFVSGYLHVRGKDGARGGGNTHAWVRVYVPGAGWIEYDPTNGLVGNRDLIRVAIVRDPGQAVPLSGSWSGFPGDFLTMDVSVEVVEEAGDVPARERIAEPRVRDVTTARG